MARAIDDHLDEIAHIPDDGYGHDRSGDNATPGELLRRLFAAVRRDLWLIAGIICAFLFVAGIFSLFQTPIYTAQSTIEINAQPQQVLGEEWEPAGEDLQGWDADRFFNTQLNILRSKSLAERVAQRLDLYESERFFSAMQAGPPADFSSDGARRDAVINLLMQSFEAQLPANTRIAELEFASVDPAMSADLVNAFAQEFVQANLQRRYDSSSYARTHVEEQLHEARERLEQSELQLNNYAREAGLIQARGTGNAESSSSSSVTADSLSQLNQAANEARANRVAAEARWRAELAQPLLSSPAALASPAVQRLLARRSELRGELESSRERYLADHPTVVRLEGDLRSLETALIDAAGEARNSVRTDFIAARAAEQQLQSQVGSLEGATLDEQARAVRYNTLAREADTNRSVYEGLLLRYRELYASAGISTSNVAIIDQAEPPVSPSSPVLLLNFAVAFGLGAACAGLIVYTREQLDDRIRAPEDVERKVGLNLLGVIPLSEFDDLQGELEDPRSNLSEAYSALCSSLLFSTRGLPKTILVTSAKASEGKSTTSLAVAQGLAHIGKRTLLLDADLRRPSLHLMVGSSNRVGLSNLLIGEVSISDAIHPSGDANLSMLPSGPLPPSPAELLSLPRVPALLDALSERFDVVVIDSAPILGLADSPVLSALVDGIVMVIASDGGTGGHIKSAMRRIRLMNGKILGAVLTKYDPDRAGNSYSSY